MKEGNREVLKVKDDFTTCSVLDYAVRVDITPEWYEDFLKKKKKKHLILRNFMARQLIKSVKNFPKVFETIENLDQNPEKDVEIRDVRVAFQNGEVIKLLKERGTLLT